MKRYPPGLNSSTDAICTLLHFALQFPASLSSDNLGRDAWDGLSEAKPSPAPAFRAVDDGFRSRSTHPSSLRILRRHGGIKFGMPGTKGVEPRRQFGKIAAPSDLAAQVEVAEHARRRHRADIEPRWIGQRLGKGLKSAHHLAALIVEPRLMVDRRRPV